MRVPQLHLPALLLLATTTTTALPLPALSVPVNLLFGIRIQTSTPPTATPPKIIFSGFEIPVPVAAESGVLISWLGNYANSIGYNTQFNAFNPGAPQNVTADAGMSVDSAAALTDGQLARVVATSYSDGDAVGTATRALGGVQTNATSNSSESGSDGTAVASSSALGRVFIATASSANVTAVLNTPSFQNAKAAEAAAGFCGGNSSVSTAPTLNSAYIPISTTADGGQQSVKSEAVVGCEPGVEAPRVDESRGTASSEGAVLTDVEGWVRCDGRSASKVGESTVFRVAVVGVYTLGRGFSGAVGGERVVGVEGEC
ncbi:hypothetical protein PtrSN002B_005891 [Pyrenophora tritici-repentis]|uniref:Uncharacterized protein n=1 Tax=Pyrenophora tritici-repentis TaxID=45151 RepID=A0A2W1EGK7_9PLEO|nr:hypothetical protein PtrV1_10259 [Pyrenophora tritici-repentis]KAF7446250.1 hypothetical protein A1F99_095410 [Pyrenophora tritici-repentis]KAG9381954.1 hypothetical protein A1F94_007608 [Pyrenophora tritici-repentis]KAI1515429.1 hypothetical protein Ptr86124_005430 [Pyrenophora tritici-repentis]KAI1535629.1 hypothetical protein PtrSN001C_006798 [Pyrenophora tritici-repentis]